jgi:protein-S-isoprenylcysteine O-methyltransferase Ste14
MDRRTEPREKPVVAKPDAEPARDIFRAFIFRTRGLYLALSITVILLLKHATGSRVPGSVYFASLVLGILVLAVRMWAAGFIGRTARSGQTHADVLLTAGPYAYVRNPMYLTALILGLLFGVMSGLWFAPLIWLGAYAFVYSQVIPYEEQYLREKFGQAYDEYRRHVPLSANMRETATPWKFSVEGETGIEDVHEPGGSRDDGGDRGGGEGAAAAIHGRGEATGLAGGRPLHEARRARRAAAARGAVHLPPLGVACGTAAG